MYRTKTPQVLIDVHETSIGFQAFITYTDCADVIQVMSPTKCNSHNVATMLAFEQLTRELAKL